MIRRTKKRKTTYLAVIFALLISIGIGYAYLSSTLYINGNVTITKNNWDVHFENIVVTKNSANASVIPTLTDNNTKIIASINLDAPGSFYEFTVDVVNKGTIDAMLSEITSTSLTEEQQKYLEYSITYDDGVAFQNKDSLPANGTETIRVKVKYRDDVSEDNYPKEDQVLVFTIQATYIQDDGTGVHRESKLLLKKIKKTAELDNIASTYVTASTGIDFSQMSSDTNGKGVYILASTKDNQYPIYYYRGAVDNNNLKFANFCWKIVRTTETGGIKLIYNGTPDSNGYCTNTTGEATYIGIGAFNNNSNDNAYVGYMYGIVGSSTYDETHANTNDSLVKTVIDEWYKTNMISYTSKLEDTIWCNDRSIVTDSTYTGNGTGITKTMYSARNRLLVNKMPTLNCRNDNDKFTVDEANGNGALTYPIALLTIDEVAFAGGLHYSATESENHTSYYLYNNQRSWTLSPDAFNGVNAGNTTVYGTGLFGNVDLHYSPSAIRPAISLAPFTVVSDGDGTSTNPYIVQ